MSGLVGPRGEALARVTRTEEGDLEADEGPEQVRIQPRKTLMQMAASQRGGMSLRGIIAEYQLVGQARDPAILQRALDKGHGLLREAERQYEERAAAQARGETWEEPG